MITFELGGVPVELISDRDIRKAVAAGRLHADTIVKVHGAGDSIVTSRADEVEALRLHFGISEPEPEPLPVAEPEPTLPPSPEGSEAGGGGLLPRDEPETWRDDIPADSLQERHSPEPMDIGVRPQSGASSALPVAFVIGGFGMAILLVALIASEGGQGPGVSADNGTAYNDLAANLAEPVPPPEREIGTARTFYAARQVVLRSQPTPRSGEMGRLGRGEEIYGTVVIREGEDQEWVRIDSGTRSGNYVWRGNLADMIPPALARLLEQRRAVPGPVAIFARADESSPMLQTLTAGTWVTLAGELASGWWEVALNNGGVGYLPPGAFSAENQGRDLWIENACAYTIELRMIYQSRYGQEDNDGGYWTIGAGQTIHAMHGASFIKAVSDDFYYHVTAPSGPWTLSNPRYFNYGRSSYPMQRANSIVDNSGNYFIQFHCNN